MKIYITFKFVVSLLIISRTILMFFFSPNKLQLRIIQSSYLYIKHFYPFAENLLPVILNYYDCALSPISLQPFCDNQHVIYCRAKCPYFATSRYYPRLTQLPTLCLLIPHLSLRFRITRLQTVRRRNRRNIN